MTYSYKRQYDEDTLEYLLERHELVIGRIEEIAVSCEIRDEYYPYFNQVSLFLRRIDEVLTDSLNGSLYKYSSNKKFLLNKDLYIELNRKNYERSFLNPAYAAAKFGKEIGQIFSAIYAELRSCIIYAYEQNLEQVLIREEFFLQLYGMYLESSQDGDGRVDADDLKNAYRDWAYDYIDDMLSDSMRKTFAATESLPKSIITEGDLSDECYLYDYGEYISDTEITMARFMAELDDATVKKMADTYTEGFRKGFVATGKDISIKKTVEIRYFLGIERVVRQAVINFREMGLETIVHYSNPSFLLGRGVIKHGMDCTSPNKQFDADHEYDRVLCFDNGYKERKLECYRDILENIKEQAAVYAGPACIEAFGEEAFVPTDKNEKLSPDKDTRKRFIEYTSRAGEILNNYVKGEERSFTIIAFPTPAIGEQFEDIFKEIIKINTLDYELYMGMQQIIIDALDKAQYVRITGMNGNKTDLKVNLVDITNDDNATKFENCVADVNIPVGEVFTTPVLEGTEGILHVKDVYLNGIQFVDLTLSFKDGIIDNVSCKNYEDAEANRKLIDTYLLFNHETLPLGEFAIGTNTVAYYATKKYGLEAIMPILIAEKTGPHFAVGDTCYSHEEDVVTYNPDGKRIAAKENRYSVMRFDKPSEAYFNCHTDITIPYDELGSLTAVGSDGYETDILKNGEFVLKGLGILNKPLSEI